MSRKTNRTDKIMNDYSNRVRFVIGFLNANEVNHEVFSKTNKTSISYEGFCSWHTCTITNSSSQKDIDDIIKKISSNICD